MSNGKQIIRRNNNAAISRSFTYNPGFHWLWIGLFVVVIALLGGSSRPDPIQNALLRPLMAMFLIPAIYHLQLVEFRRVAPLVTLLGLLLTWMIIQVVPLPPSLWQGLPDRGMIAQLDQLAGLGDTWRPLSLAPFRGQNAIFGMVVPVAALALAVAMKMTTRTILIAIVAIGLIDAVFGLLQVISGPRSPLYLFSITSRGAPAGIFANENHSAVFSALVLLAVARLGFQERTPHEPAWLRWALAPTFLFILLAVLVTGSRAGFAASLIALLAAAAMALLRKREKVANTGEAFLNNALEPRSELLILPFGLVLVFIIGGFVWLQRAPALEDILMTSSFDDLRWSLWPLLSAMADEHWLLGTGFGSFDAVYRFYEPTELLLPRYVNHAHNDWAQLVIEGGLPAMLIVVAGLGWMCKTSWVISRRSDSAREHLIFWVAWGAIIMAASTIDYPLRTPIFQCVSIWLLVSLALERARIGPQMVTG